MNESIISRIAEEEDPSIENLGGSIQLDETPEEFEKELTKKKAMSADELLRVVSREKYTKDVAEEVEETPEEEDFSDELEEEEDSDEEPCFEEDELEEDYEESPKLIKSRDVVKAISNLYK
jgi:hypothetical protein